MLTAQASGAQVKPFRLAVNNTHGDGMDIGYPAPVGMALGVTHIVTELRRFPA
jgi:hypothetical protein